MKVLINIVASLNIDMEEAKSENRTLKTRHLTLSKKVILRKKIIKLENNLREILII